MLTVSSGTCLTVVAFFGALHFVTGTALLDPPPVPTYTPPALVSMYSAALWPSSLGFTIATSGSGQVPWS